MASKPKTFRHCRNKFRSLKTPHSEINQYLREYDHLQRCLNVDSCITPTAPEKVLHISEPLPRFFRHQLLNTTYSPIDPLESITTYKHYFYPKPTKKTALPPENLYYHYRPLGYRNESITKTGFPVYEITEEIKTAVVPMPPNFFIAKPERKTKRAIAETVMKSDYYEKPVQRRKDPRLWWQKPQPYIPSMYQVRGETTTTATYKPPPKDHMPIRPSKPMPTIRLSFDSDEEY